MSSYSKHKGITLLESMVALLVAFLVLFGLMKALISIFNTLKHVMINHQIEVQALKAITSLSHSAHQAGDLGCLKLTEASAHSLGVIPFQSLHGSLSVTYRDPSTAVLLRTENPTQITIAPALNVQIKDRLVLNDCHQVAIGSISGLSGPNSSHQTIRLTTPLPFTFNPGTPVGVLRQEHFFVGKTKRRDAEGHLISALFIQDYHRRIRPLVSGIEQFEVHTIRQPKNNSNPKNQAITCSLTIKEEES